MAMSGAPRTPALRHHSPFQLVTHCVPSWDEFLTRSCLPRHHPVQGAATDKMKIAAYGGAFLVCSAICATIIYAPQSRTALVLGLMIFGGGGSVRARSTRGRAPSREGFVPQPLVGPLGATLTLARVRGVAIRDATGHCLSDCSSSALAAGSSRRLG